MFSVITIFYLSRAGAYESSFKELEYDLKRLNQHNSYGLADGPICCNVPFL